MFAPPQGTIGNPFVHMGPQGSFRGVWGPQGDPSATFSYGSIHYLPKDVAASVTPTISGIVYPGTGAFAVDSGTLATGLTLDADTGVISGTPTAVEDDTAVISLTDSNARVWLATFQTSVGIPVSAFTYGDDPATDILDDAATHAVTITGTTPITYTLFSGTLPASYSLNASTGAISTAAVTAGDVAGSPYAVVVKATNAWGTTNSGSFDIACSEFSPAGLTDLKGWWDPESEVFTDAALLLVAASTQSVSRASEAALVPGASWEIGLWFRTTSVAGLQVIHAKAASGGYEFALFLNATSLTAFVGGVATAVAWGTPIAADTWYFVRYGRSAVDDKGFLSVDNGAAVQTAANATPNTGANAFIFGNWTDATLPFDGKISSAFFSRARALTASERTAVWNAGAGVNYTDLPSTLKAEAAADFHYWPLCEASGARGDQHGTAHLSAINAPGSAQGTIEIDVSTNTGESVNNTTVKRWIDQSANLYELVAATFAAQPIYTISGINSRPTVESDGADDRLSVAFAEATQPNRLFIAGAIGTLGAGNLGFAGSAATDVRVYWNVDEGTDALLKIFAGGGDVIYADIVLDTDQHIYEFLFSGDSSLIVVDAATVATGGAGNPGADGFTGIMIGDSPIVTFSNFEYGDVVLVDAAMSAGDVTLTRAYLQGRWGTP